MNSLMMAAFQDYLPGVSSGARDTYSRTGVTKNCNKCHESKDLCDFPMTQSVRIYHSPKYRKDTCRKCLSQNHVQKYRTKEKLKKIKKGGWVCADCGHVSGSMLLNCHGCGFPRATEENN